MFKLALDVSFTDFRHECHSLLQILLALAVSGVELGNLPPQYTIPTLMLQLSLTLNSVGWHLKIANQPSYGFFLVFYFFLFFFFFIVSVFFLLLLLFEFSYSQTGNCIKCIRCCQEEAKESLIKN